MTRTAISAGALGITLLVAAVSRRGGEDPGHTAGRHGLEGWVARKIADESRDEREIEALLEEVYAAYRRGDQAAAAARMDFPFLEITDDWKGEVIARSWDREAWMERTAPLFRYPAPELQRTHRHAVFVVSDSLASVADEQTVVMGRRELTIRRSSILVRKDRSWLLRASVEGGWGDTPLAKAAPVVQQASAPAPGSGAGAEAR